MMYSPWTGMKPDAIRQADMMGTVGRGVMGGMAQDQASDQADSQNQLNQSQLRLNEAKTNYYQKAGGQNELAPTTPASGNNSSQIMDKVGIWDLLRSMYQ
jgi:hypothetical protein